MYLTLLLALSMNAAPPGLQQDDPPEQLAEFLKDPYSGNDPDLMRQAGIISTGNMYWADGHTTKDIQDNLGHVKIIWAETAHFKIGCSLPSYAIDKNSKLEKSKLRDELKTLSSVLPDIKVKTKQLDSWLRLYLYLQRAEGLYSETQELLGLTDKDFPSGPGELVEGRYMGEGPYLGMTNKFTLMLFEKKSSLGRYRNGFLGASGSAPIRFMYPQDGCLLFAVAQETDGVSSDTSLHCMFIQPDFQPAAGVPFLQPSAAIVAGGWPISLECQASR